MDTGKLALKLVAFTFALVLLAAICAYFLKPAPIPVNTPQKAQVAASVAKAQTEMVKVPAVKVLKKADIYKKVKVPPEVIVNPQKQITAVVDVPASKAGTEVTSVIDTDTGETEIYYAEKPLPFFAFENEKRVGVGYQVVTNGDQEVKVYAEYTFARIGKTHVSIYAEVYNNTRKLNPVGKAGIQLDYRF